MKNYTAQLTAIERRLDRMVKLRSDNKSGITGVHWHGKKWESQIRVNGKCIHLGLFANLDEAAAARKGAEKVLGR